MVAHFLKRFFAGALVFLAAISFFLVPVGKKPPVQHLIAIFSTRPARDAASAFSGMARRVTTRAAAEVKALQDAHRTPKPQEQPPQRRRPHD